mgnify:CR=1 FL=1
MQKQFVNIQLDEKVYFFYKIEFDLKEILKQQKANLEKTIIDKALKKFNGNKSKTSKFLDIDYKTILNKIKKYNLGQTMELLP